MHLYAGPLARVEDEEDRMLGDAVYHRAAVDHCVDGQWPDTSPGTELRARSVICDNRPTFSGQVSGNSGSAGNTAG